MSLDQRATPHESGEMIHHRETRRQIWLPMLGAVALILVFVGIAALLPRFSQVSFLSDFMLTLLVLCPMLICQFVVYVVVMMAVYGMYRLHRATGTPLERLERVTHSASQRLTTMTDTLNQRVADVSSQTAPLLKVLSFLDSLPKEGNHHDDSRTPKP